MKLKITEVSILSSQTGEGLRVGDKTLACARVTKVAGLEEGKTLYDYAKDCLCLGYKPNEAGNVLMLDSSDLSNASNYVLVVRDAPKEDGSLGDVSTIENTTDITRLFGLPDSDAEMLDKYLGHSAEQRGLILTHYTDADTGADAIIFINKFDREINDAILDDAPDEAMESYRAMLNNPDFRTEIQTDNFIRMFLMTVVQAGQNRFNLINRTQVIEKAAELIKSIRYWEDGKLHTPTVKDINESINEIANYIEIQ